MSLSDPPLAHRCWPIASSTDALGVAQAAIVRELAVRLVGVPRRHDAVADFVADVLRARTDILVGQKRHRPDLAGPVTAVQFL